VQSVPQVVGVDTCERYREGVPFCRRARRSGSETAQRRGVVRGRVVTVEIVGTTGTEVPASSFALGALIGANNQAHCASNWYAVTNGP